MSDIYPVVEALSLTLVGDEIRFAAKVEASALWAELREKVLEQAQASLFPGKTIAIERQDAYFRGEGSHVVLNVHIKWREISCQLFTPRAS